MLKFQVFPGYLKIFVQNYLVFFVLKLSNSMFFKVSRFSGNPIIFNTINNYGIILLLNSSKPLHKTTFKKNTTLCKNSYIIIDKIL